MTAATIPNTVRICDECFNLVDGPVCGQCALMLERSTIAQRTAEIIEIRRGRRRRAWEERRAREFWHIVAARLGVTIGFLGCALIMLLFWMGVHAGLAWLAHGVGW